MNYIAGTLILLALGRASAKDEAPEIDKQGSPTSLPTPPDRELATSRNGGETIDDATLIPGIPYCELGNTTAYADDYNAVCPYTVTGGRDVVYKYVPDYDHEIAINVCQSWFDTKLYVFEDSAENVIACNDDSCNPYDWHYGISWQSFLEDLSVQAGHVYYIVIDGYFSPAYGVYTLRVSDGSELPSCDHACPPDGSPEGEPECYSGYVDQYNGGCSSTPAVFSPLTCGSDPLLLCGEGGVFVGGHDTDWYEFTLSEPKTVTISACGNFPLYVKLQSIDADCSTFTIRGDGAYSHKTIILSCALDPGHYAYEIGAFTWHTAYPCESARYYFEVEGLCPPATAVEKTSWGSVKKLFR